MNNVPAFFINTSKISVDSLLFDLVDHDNDARIIGVTFDADLFNFSNTVNYTSPSGTSISVKYTVQ